MKLSIPPLGQRNENWKLKKMGGGGSIGSYGCLLTCHSMSLIYYGHSDMSPDILNRVCIEKKVYDGNFINFYAMGKLFGDYLVVEMYNCVDTPCDMSKIDNHLAKGKPVIAGIGASADTPKELKYDGTIDHFVLIIGKTDDGHYIINDPWEGETYYFDAKYGDPAKYIFGLRIYDGTPKDTNNHNDTIDELTGKLSSCNTALSEKSAECARLIEDLATQERDNQELSDQLNKSRGERDTAIWEKTQLDIKVKSLQEKIESLEKGIATSKTEIDTLKTDLVKCEKASVSDMTTSTLIRIILERIFKK